MQLFLVDIQPLFARYFYLAKSICSCFARTLYDINLVVLVTYRVIYGISKISQKIYINKKTTCRNKSLFGEEPNDLDVHVPEARSRKKVIATAKHHEGVYNRTGKPSVPFL